MDVCRKKFSIKDEWVLPFEPVPIIEIPSMGNLAAVEACKKYKVKTQGDRDALALAKDEVYKLGFRDGKLLVGEHVGEPVKTVKPIIRQEMIDRGQVKEN